MAYVIINDPTGGLTSTVRCGNENTSTKQYATVTGGYQNTSSGKYSFFDIFCSVKTLGKNPEKNTILNVPTKLIKSV